MEYISIFDILKIGVGPSSSHTLGPWKAARIFLSVLKNEITEGEIKSLDVFLYGSLALTGKGHYTDKAIILGLMNEDPETTDISGIEEKINKVKSSGKITIHKWNVDFNPDEQIHFLKKERLPFHSNALKFKVTTTSGVIEKTYYSTGGGFVVEENGEIIDVSKVTPPLYCDTAEELASVCVDYNLSISDVVWKNELSRENDPVKIKSKLLQIWEVMKDAAYKGCHSEGELPGGLHVKRRAAEMNKNLLRVTDYKTADAWIEAMKIGNDFSKIITRISCLAIAVNEVNASMGRIVTAPTNGSAGVIPAVLFYYICFSGKNPGQEDIIRFLMTAAEIGKYFKLGATISAAAGGCQAEIGVSSSMAAAALTEGLGGSVPQCLMAAEIAAEHHLGMTCDPVGGLVQIPCIERNSMGAIKAITATMIAMASKPTNAKVSLDNVIQTMKETAENMNFKYKETSLGGLAVNIGVNLPEC